MQAQTVDGVGLRPLQGQRARGIASGDTEVQMSYNFMGRKIILLLSQPIKHV